MPTAENAQLSYEAGQLSYPMAALVDSGDLTSFTSSATYFSRRSGYAPVILPDGVVSGGAVTPEASATDDEVDVAGFTVYQAGVLQTVAADPDQSITRPATAVSKVNSITVNSSQAVAVVAGTDGSTTAFSETRGAAGGPPYIPVGSVEVAQIRVISDTSAVITAAQIFQVPGNHQERADTPLWSEIDAEAKVTFYTALPASHTGDIAKGVYGSCYDPIFTALNLASDYQPPENSHSVSSVQVYGATLGASSSSLNQGSFKAYLQNGVTDALVVLKNETLWFKFLPNRYQTAKIMTQGKLGISRTFPAGGNIVADCTISASFDAVEAAS